MDAYVWLLQLLIYCLLFTAMVKIAVIGVAVNGLYFCPKTVQDQAIGLGLIDRNTMNRKRKRFMIPFYIVMQQEDQHQNDNTNNRVRQGVGAAPAFAQQGRKENAFST